MYSRGPPTFSAEGPPSARIGGPAAVCAKSMQEAHLQWFPTEIIATTSQDVWESTYVDRKLFLSS